MLMHYTGDVMSAGVGRAGQASGGWQVPAGPSLPQSVALWPSHGHSQSVSQSCPHLSLSCPTQLTGILVISQ